MKTKVMIINLASVVAIASLLIGLGVAILVFTGRQDMDTFYTVFNLASLAWFLSAPLWFVPGLFGKGFEQAGREAWLRPGDKEEGKI